MGKTRAKWAARLIEESKPLRQEEKRRGPGTMKCSCDLSPNQLAKFLDSQGAELFHFRAKRASPRIWRPSVSRSKALKDDFNVKCGVTGAILSDTVQPLSYFNKLSTKEEKNPPATMNQNSQTAPGEREGFDRIKTSQHGCAQRCLKLLSPVSAVSEVTWPAQ